MSTLLLRLSGPMQSWGVSSRFRFRDTGREPSKSGVVGLLCAALGRARTSPVDDITDLFMAVRVDREGVMQTDYHTAGGQSEAKSGYGVARFGTSQLEAVISFRQFLADANFLVGLQARTAEEEGLLRRLDAALVEPRWPLCLGRHAFMPAEPVRLPDSPPMGPGLRPEPLMEALLNYPWPDVFEQDEPAHGLRFVIDDPTGASSDVRTDVPVSFDPQARRYTTRTVVTEFHNPPTAEMPALRESR